MATVKLTPSIIREILRVVEHKFGLGAVPLPKIPSALSTKASDELLEHIISREAIDQLLAIEHPMYKVATASSFNLHFETHALTLSPSRPICIPKQNSHVEVPGLGLVSYSYSGAFVLRSPDVDTSLLPPTVSAELPSFFSACAAHSEHKQRRADAVSRMRVFLESQASLKSAIAAFGPSLWEYIPEHLRKKHLEVVERKPRRVSATPSVDVSELVAIATISKLSG